MVARRYPSLQQNGIGLSEIIFCNHQIDLLPSWIDGRAFFMKTFIYNVGFLP